MHISTRARRWSSRHETLVIPPLLIITTFCFVFVMMQPNHIDKGSTAATQAKHPMSRQPTTLSQSTTNLPTLDQVPTSSQQATSATQPATTQGTSAASTSTSNNLQAATQNTTSAAPTTPTIANNPTSSPSQPPLKAVVDGLLKLHL